MRSDKQQGLSERLFVQVPSAGSVTDPECKIIYPNGGSKEHPKTIDCASKYVEPNPFPGYYVSCVAEVLYNGEWNDPGWYDWDTDAAAYAGGVKAYQANDDKICIQTGNLSKWWNSNLMPNGFGITGSSMTPAVMFPIPCRVKVRKIGKIT